MSSSLDTIEYWVAHIKLNLQELEIKTLVRYMENQNISKKLKKKIFLLIYMYFLVKHNIFQ